MPSATEVVKDRRRSHQQHRSYLPAETGDGGGHHPTSRTSPRKGTWSVSSSPLAQGRPACPMASVRMVDVNNAEQMRKSSSVRKVRSLGSTGLVRRGSMAPVAPRQDVLRTHLRKDGSVAHASSGRAVASLAAAAQVDLVCNGSWSPAGRGARGQDRLRRADEKDLIVPVVVPPHATSSEQAVASGPLLIYRKPNAPRRPRSPAVAAQVAASAEAAIAEAFARAGLLDPRGEPTTSAGVPDCGLAASTADVQAASEEPCQQGISFESIDTMIEAADTQNGLEVATCATPTSQSVGGGLCSRQQQISPCMSETPVRLRRRTTSKCSTSRSNSYSRALLEGTMSTLATSIGSAQSTKASGFSGEQDTRARASQSGSSWSTLWELALHRTECIQAPKRKVMLLHSVFDGRPPVLLFTYTKACGAPQRRLTRAYAEADFAAYGDEAAGPPKMFFSHGKEVHEYNAVLNTLRNGGLYRTSRSRQTWALYWGGVPKAEALRTFHPFQKTNHFPSSWQIGRKDYLWQHVRKLQRQFPQMPCIMPQAYVLPGDARAWEAAREAHPKALWIWKPVNSSCGRGIRVVRSTLDPSFEKKVSQRAGVVQRYVERPLLLDGYKFDLRLYVVITSYDPLKIYLFSEGLVRLATEKYSTSAKSINHRTMHLTNYSVNKTAGSYKKNLDSVTSTASTTTPTHGLEDHEAEGAEDSGDEACPQEDGHLQDDDGLVDEVSDADENEDASDEAFQEPADDGQSASKWSLKQLKIFLEAKGVDYGFMMTKIKDLIVKSFIAVEPVMVSAFHAGANFTGSAETQAVRGSGPNQTCFEIYGMDVLVDADLQPWLLEVNICPSFSSSSPLDKRIKTQLVADSLTLVGFSPYDHTDVCQALREDRGCQKLAIKHQTSQKSHNVRSVTKSSLSELGEAEWGTIIEAHDEHMRCGGFERIFPTQETADCYGHMFQVPRYANLVLARWLKEGGGDCFRPEVCHLLPSFVPKQVCFEAC
mmetsp:Transcript_16182/g.37186  ORF Transcript_16182/g.37186 Transcript_16182/m.37186 type:complete len:991 (+) Transcript_16182:152-3124(+)